MRVVAILLGIVWTIGGLAFLALGAEESEMFFLGFGAIIATFSSLSVLFLIMRRDLLARICVIIAAGITVPIGLVFGFVAMAALKPGGESKHSSALDEAIRRAR